jgi:acetyl esterase/lipase
VKKLEKLLRGKEGAMLRWIFFFVAGWLAVAHQAEAQSARVVDIPTRPGVTQRFIVMTPNDPKASVILFAGGHGGLQIYSSGKLKWGANNFVVRNQRLFAEHGLTAVVVDAPSDRQSAPYLGGFRQTPEHVADIKAVIAWLKQQASIPVWLVGTSRGTQSAAHIAVALADVEGGPDGLVLTSTILVDPKSRPVPNINLHKLTLPTLLVHHKQDVCQVSSYSDLPRLMDKLSAVLRKELISVDGGLDRGDPCEAQAYHGFNGLDGEVVGKIAAWVVPK